jgi:hypothetical protein
MEEAMANRCSVYLLENDPNESAEGLAQDLGEWGWSIPWSFQLLASANPRPCPSRIWKTEEDQLIAITADFDAGRRRLAEFLKALPTSEAGGVFDAEKLAEKIAATEAHLKGRDARFRFVLLEAAEILEMGLGGDDEEDEDDEDYEYEDGEYEDELPESLGAANAQLIESIVESCVEGFEPIFADLAGTAKIFGVHKAWESLGLDAWEDTAYYSVAQGRHAQAAARKDRRKGFFGRLFGH